MQVPSLHMMYLQVLQLTRPQLCLPALCAGSQADVQLCLCFLALLVGPAANIPADIRSTFVMVQLLLSIQAEQ
jgi:hypothetical protein